MRDTKLIHFLLLLSKKDRTKFRDFLGSPFFNKKEELLSLYIALEGTYLKSPKINDTEEEIWGKMKLESGFDQNRFRKWKTALLEHLMSFFAYQKLEDKEGLKAGLKLQFLNEKKESRYFKKQYEEALKQLNAQGPRTSKRDFSQHLQNLEFEFTLYQNRQGGRNALDGLDKIYTSLENGYLAQRLQLEYALRMRKKLLSTPSPSVGIGGLIEQYHANDSSDAYTQIWYRLVMTLEHPQEREHYHVLRQLLALEGANFPFSEAVDMFTGALNYSMILANSGVQGFDSESFELYKEMLAQKLILDKGKISPWHFKNIVFYATKLGEFDWATNFIEEFSSRLTVDHHGNALSYTRGVLEFYKQNYNQAEIHFNELLNDFVDPYYGSDTRVWLLKIFFETGNTIGLESLIDSFRMYLNRHKSLGDVHKELYQNFIKYVRRMVNTPPNDLKRIEVLWNDLMGEKGHFDIWLKEKVGEMKGD